MFAHARVRVCVCVRVVLLFVLFIVGVDDNRAGLIPDQVQIADVEISGKSPDRLYLCLLFVSAVVSCWLCRCFF